MAAVAIAPPSVTPISFKPLRTPAKFCDWHQYVPSSDSVMKQLTKENTAWEKFKEKFRTDTSLIKAIDKLSQKSDLTNGWPADLLTVADAFSSQDFLRLKIPLRKILVAMTTSQRKELFDCLIKRSMKCENFSGIKNCLELISWNELHQMLNMTGDDMKETIQCLASCENEFNKKAAMLQAMTSTSTSNYVAGLIHGILDTLLMSISFFEIGKEPSTSWDASYLLKAYGEVLGAPLALFAALSAVLPFWMALLITAAAVLAIVLLLMAYIKWWKPCPENVEPCINLTALAKQGKIEPVYGCEKDINKLIKLLSSSTDGARLHPILVGPSGVGKTERVKGLALRIAQGRVPDCLKNKTVFMVTTPHLMSKDQYDNKDKIRRMIERLGKYKKDVIVFFDEIHACMDKTSKMSDKLKNVFDTTPESLPYCIGATNEYDKIAADDAFAGRFDKIEVKESKTKSTLWILRDMAYREAKDFHIPDDCIEAIAKMKGKLAHPKGPKRMLAKVISNMKLQNSGYRSNDEYSKKISKKESLMSAYRLSQDPQLLKELNSLQTDIDKLDGKAKEAKDELAAHLELNRFRMKQKESLFEIAANTLYSEDSKNAAKVEANKKFIRFAQEFMIPHLDAEIEKDQKRLNLKSIQQLVAEELK